MAGPPSLPAQPFSTTPALTGVTGEDSAALGRLHTLPRAESPCACASHRAAKSWGCPYSLCSFVPLSLSPIFFGFLLLFLLVLGFVLFW